jgi:Tol biopolymer transport system component
MARSGWSRSLLLALLAALAAVWTAPASAQYFGRNKVSYRSFDFRILKTEHFDVYYYEEEAVAAAEAARMAERWYERLNRVLDHELSGRQPLILYASHPHFEQTNAISGELDESTGGVTESLKRRIVLPFSGSLAETDHVLGHELVHAFQYDITGRNRAAGGTPAIARLPLWFVEGMAEYLTVGPVDAHTAMWMRDAVRTEKKLPDLDDLNDYRWFPYRWGHALWAYIGERWGDRAVGEVLRTAARGAEYEAAFGLTLGISADSLASDWHRALRAQSARVGGEPPSAQARTLIAGDRERGRYNLAPALSPDGRWLMFLSERELFSIELFLADARTGRIVRRVTKTAIDPHLQSLQFIGGAGAWSPDSRRFAFATIRDGEPAIQIVDVPSGDVRRRFKVTQAGEITTLTWSPDGAQIAFSGLVGGQTDLFSIELASGAVRRWTSDLPADLQPAWSPDGTTIAFATERFGTDLQSLEIAPLRLATLDVASGEVRRLPAFEQGKHLNPQWSPDGRSLYTVADPTGISQIYRLDLASGAWTRVVAVGTGVSGLTASSPAISVARGEDRMVFAAYENGAHRLLSLDSLATRGSAPPVAERVIAASIFPRDLEEFAVTDTVLALVDTTIARRPPEPPPAFRGGAAGFPPPADSVTFVARRLPVPSRRGEVASLLGRATLGLADTSAFTRVRYRPGLSLDRVSQVGVALGTSGSGLSGAGGATLFWSDMLGDHNLATFLEVSSDAANFLNNVAAVIDYRNLRNRWNWGLEVSQIPYLTRQFSVDYVQLENGVGTREQDERRWQIERRVLGRVAYPFNRVRRVEFAGGFQNIGFDSELETRVWDPNGNLVVDETEDLDDDRPALSLGLASAALVHDNSLFGGTSPIAGSRGRLEIEPVFGDLQFAGALADYRHYVMPKRPFTLAGRALHYGRYGPDAEDDILSPLFVGYQSLVRGYDQESFTLDECDDPSGFGPCPAFDRLFGSKLFVFNAEARLPLFGVLGIVPSPAVPPIEAAVFFDAGTAWHEADEPTFLGGDRKVVTSQGVALRVNVFGFLIAEIDLVKPNQRPEQGWYWQFGLQPGF